MSEAQLAQIKSTYRTGARTVKAAYQNIESGQSDSCARENARLTSEELLSQTAAYHRWLYTG